MLGTDNVAEVIHSAFLCLLLRYIVVGEGYVGRYVEKTAQATTDVHIEVVQVLPILLEKRFYVVGIIFKERRFAVGAFKRVPVNVAPVAVRTDCSRRISVFSFLWLCRHAESLLPVWSGNEAAVAKSLLYKAVVLLYQNIVVAVQLLIPLHRTEVC